MAESTSLFCSLCEEEGIQIQAFYWCTDCSSFLCYQCWRHHQRNRASKHHKTIPTEDYQLLPDCIKNTSNDCPSNGKRFEMHCSVHECVCCVQCLAEEHNECQDLKNVTDSEVLSMVKSSASVVKVHDQLMILQQNYDQILKYLENERTAIKKQKTTKKQEVKTMRKLIDAHLDKLEEQLNDKIKSEAQSTIDQLNATTTQVLTKLNATQQLINDYETMLNYATNLQTFMGLDAFRKNIGKEREFLETTQENQVLYKSMFEVKFSPALASLFDIKTFGDILTSHSKPSIEIKELESTNSMISVPSISLDDISLTLLKKYNVSHGRETFVSGCDLMSNGDFLIADQLSRYVKHYMKQGTYFKLITTEKGHPFDVCCIDNKRCAISTTSCSYNHAYILIVNIRGNKILKRVDVGKGFKYLSFDKNLIISRNEKLVDEGEIIHLSSDGKIINKFSAGKSGGVCSSKSMVYWTDWSEEGSVVCSDEFGNIRWRYQGSSIRGPRGITVDTRGVVFIACSDSSSIVAIHPDGKTSKAIISKKFVLQEPFALAINRTEGKLMICDKREGLVFLYQI